MATHIPKCDTMTPYGRAEKLSEVLESHAQEAFPGVYCMEANDGDEDAGRSSSVLAMVDGRTMIVTITVEEVLDTYTDEELRVEVMPMEGGVPKEEFCEVTDMEQVCMCDLSDAQGDALEEYAIEHVDFAPLDGGYGDE